jgi:hypothetical protein
MEQILFPGTDSSSVSQDVLSALHDWNVDYCEHNSPLVFCVIILNLALYIRPFALLFVGLIQSLLED